MPTIKLFTIFGAVLFFFGLAVQSEEAWKKIENSSFSFSVPSSFKKTETHGIDSFVEEYLADSIEVSFDYGIYSNNFDDWPKETKFENVKINGKAARIGTAARDFYKGFPFSTQVYIKLDRGVALSMFAECKSEKEVALARKIFKTIAFKAKKP